MKTRLQILKTKLLAFLLVISCILGNASFVAFAAEQPGSFSITSPDDGESVDDDFKVKWSSSQNADYYTISIKDLTDGSYVTELEEVEDTYYKVKYKWLTPGHSYRIGVVSYNNEGGKRNGGTVNFKVTASKPGSFSITAPDSGEKIEEDFKIKWSSSENADYYTISIKDLTNGSYITELEEVEDTYYKVKYSWLTPGHSYRIGLVSYNDYDKRNGGTVDFSVPEKKAAQPGTFSISSPSSGSNINSDFTVKWTTSQNAEYYTISIKDLTTGNYVTELERVTGTSYSVRFNRLITGHSYRIGLVSYGEDGTTRNGGTVDFSVPEKKAAQPGTFSISSPSSGSNINSDFTVKWTTSQNAEYYTISIKDLTMGNYVTELERVTGTSYSVRFNRLITGHSYRIGLVSYGADGTTRNGGTVDFNVPQKKAEQPGAFSISSPSSGSSINSNFTVKWTTSQNAEYYTISIKDLTTGSYVTELEGTIGTSYNVYFNQLTAGHSYRIGLVSYGADGTTRNGGTVDFSVPQKKAEQPGAFSISSPSSGSSINSNFTVKWTTSQNAQYYTISIKDLTTGSYVTELEATVNTSYNVYFNQLTAGHSYRIGLVSHGEDGITRNGGTVDFSVPEKKAEQPGTFSISSPSNGSTISSNFTVKWTTSQNAQYYTISIKDLTTGSYVTELEATVNTSYNVYLSQLIEGHSYRIGLVSYGKDGTKRNGGTVDFSVPEKKITSTPTPTATTAPEKKAEQPGTFSITNPSNGKSVESNFTVKWSKSANAKYYTISIKDLTTGAYVTELEKVTGTSYSVKFSKLSAGHSYRIGLVSYGEEGTKRNGGTVEFSIPEKKVTATPAPKITATPIPKITATPTPKITATPTPKITATPTPKITATPTPKVTVTPSRRDESLGDFAIVAPVDEMTIAATADLIVYWTKSSGAEYYKYSLKDLTAGEVRINSTMVTSRSVIIPGKLLEAGHEYIIYVTAYDGEGTRKGQEVTVVAKANLSEKGMKTEAEVATPVLKDGSISITESVTNGVATLKFKSDLLAADLKYVKETVINFYDKNDGNSCTLSKSFNGAISEFSPEIDAGDYGVEVVYYGTDNKSLASGESYIEHKFGIKNYEIADMLYGDFNVLYGVVSARNGIASVSVQVVNDSGKELMNVSATPNNVKTYDLSSYELDHQLEFNKLPIGKMRLRITVKDTKGQSFVKELAFLVREAAAPKVTGLKDTLIVLQGNDLRLAGTLSSEKRIEKVTVSLKGVSGKNVTKNVSKNTYSLSAIVLPLESLNKGTYNAEISVVLRGSSKSITVKEFKIYVIKESTFETGSTSSGDKVDKTLSTRMQQAVSDGKTLDFANFNKVYNQFRYVQHYVDREKSGGWGTTLGVLNETCYYLYNGGADMLFGTASKEGIIKAFLKEEYLMTKDEMQEAIREEAENVGTGIEVAQLFNKLSDKQADALYKELKQYVKDSSVKDWRKLTDNTISDDSLIKILSPYLSDTGDLKKIKNGYKLSDDITCLLDNMKQGKIKDAKTLKNTSVLSGSGMNKLAKYAGGTLVFIDVAFLTNEVCSTLSAYANVSEIQIAKLKEIRELATDKETINALDELIAEVEKEGMKGVQDVLKTLGAKGTDMFFDWGLSILMGPYALLYSGAQVVSNALCGGGSSSQASHYIVALMDSNLSAAQAMVNKYNAFMKTPTEQSLQDFCTAISYFLDSTENCIGLGTMYETDRILWMSDSKKQKEYEAKEMKRLDPLKAFYNKYKTR